MTRITSPWIRLACWHIICNDIEIRFFFNLILNKILIWKSKKVSHLWENNGCCLLSDAHVLCGLVRRKRTSISTKWLHKVRRHLLSSQLNSYKKNFIFLFLNKETIYDKWQVCPFGFMRNSRIECFLSNSTVLWTWKLGNSRQYFKAFKKTTCF